MRPIAVETIANPGGDCNLFCIFAAQHLLGARDAAPAVYLCHPELTVSLGVLEAEDIPGGQRHSRPWRRCLRAVERGTWSRQIRSFWENYARWVQKPICGKAPELPLIQAAAAGCRTGSVALAVRGLRAHAGKAALCDCDTLTRLLGQLIETY